MKPPHHPRLMTLEQRELYRKGIEAGIIRGLAQAAQALVNAGVPPEHHEAVHEALDAAHHRASNTKREPRSQLWKGLLNNAK